MNKLKTPDIVSSIVLLLVIISSLFIADKNLSIIILLIISELFGFFIFFYTLKYKSPFGHLWKSIKNHYVLFAYVDLLATLILLVYLITKLIYF